MKPMKVCTATRLRSVTCPSHGLVSGLRSQNSRTALSGQSAPTLLFHIHIAVQKFSAIFTETYTIMVSRPKNLRLQSKPRRCFKFVRKKIMDTVDTFKLC